MHPLLQNKFVRVGGVIVLVVVVIFFLLVVVLGSLNDARSGPNMGMSADMAYGLPSAPAYDGGYANERAMVSEDSIGSSYYPVPEPVPGGYTSDLEKYETTTYSVTARTKQFDEVCSAIRNLKSDQEIHFKALNESTNNCSSTFYVKEAKASEVLTTLTTFKGVEYVRNTDSVTRHRQQIQSQTSIIQQQLANVQRSLTTAETQLNNLTDFYLTSEDVATLSKRVNESLALIDQLTERKIGLTAQLNNLYQQAADLEARMGVVEFSVNINRSNPIYLEKDSQKWERAWDDLSNTFTDTLIGLSAFFGIFILWILRFVIYGLVLLVLARLLWKLIQFVWSK